MARFMQRTLLYQISKNKKISLFIMEGFFFLRYDNKDEKEVLVR